MRITKLTGFEGTETEKAVIKFKVIGVMSNPGASPESDYWIRIRYKVPHRKKEHKMWIRRDDTVE